MKPGTGHLSATFEIFLNSCGMSSSGNQQGGDYGGHGPTPSGSYVENTIIVQYDPYVQEVNYYFSLPGTVEEFFLFFLCILSYTFYNYINILII